MRHRIVLKPVFKTDKKLNFNYHSPERKTKWGNISYPGKCWVKIIILLCLFSSLWYDKDSQRGRHPPQKTPSLIWLFYSNAEGFDPPFAFRFLAEFLIQINDKLQLSLWRMLSIFLKVCSNKVSYSPELCSGARSKALPIFVKFNDAGKDETRQLWLLCLTTFFRSGNLLRFYARTSRNIFKLPTICLILLQTICLILLQTIAGNNLTQ